jgi:hypothetical protein
VRCRDCGAGPDCEAAGRELPEALGCVDGDEGYLATELGWVNEAKVVIASYYLVSFDS